MGSPNPGKHKRQTPADSTVYERLGEFLRATREARGLSQLALAASLGVPSSRISQMEQGSRWTLENLDDVAAALGLEGWEMLRIVSKSSQARGPGDAEQELFARLRASPHNALIWFIDEFYAKAVKDEMARQRDAAEAIEAAARLKVRTEARAATRRKD